MNDLAMFMSGASAGAIVLIQYLRWKYTLIERGSVSLRWIDYEFPDHHPAKNQIVYEAAHDITPDRRKRMENGNIDQ